MADIAASTAANEKIDADPLLLPALSAMPPAMAGALTASLAPIPSARRLRATALLAFHEQLVLPVPSASPDKTPPGYGPPGYAPLNTVPLETPHA